MGRKSLSTPFLTPVVAPEGAQKKIVPSYQGAARTYGLAVRPPALVMSRMTTAGSVSRRCPPLGIVVISDGLRYLAIPSSFGARNTAATTSLTMEERRVWEAQGGGFKPGLLTRTL